MAVWLVTGSSGFLGRHLLERLRDCRPEGVAVVALGRRPPSARDDHRFVAADLEDPASLVRALEATAPEVVFHLAGVTPPAAAEALYRGNTLATFHLLTALRTLQRPVRVLLAGSAAELGPVPDEALPVGEDYRGRPTQVYGWSKYLATAAGLAAEAPLEVKIARIFNPIGPGLPPSQAFGHFAAVLAAAAPGPDPVRLPVGDVDARRDFIDVRDVADALVALASSVSPAKLFHVGTGRSHRVGDGLERLIRLSGREVIVVPKDPGPTPHPAAPRDSRADIRRIVGETSWRPAISWEQSLEDLWNAPRGACNRG